MLAKAVADDAFRDYRTLEELLELEPFDDTNLCAHILHTSDGAGPEPQSRGSVGLRMLALAWSIATSKVQGKQPSDGMERTDIA